MIFIGQKAKSILKKNLYDNANIYSKGIFKEGNYWQAFDNTSGNCYVEEFKSEAQAVGWINDFFEMSEIEEVRISKVFMGLYYIKSKGFLITSITNETMKVRFKKLILCNR